MGLFCCWCIFLCVCNAPLKYLRTEIGWLGEMVRLVNLAARARAPGVYVVEERATFLAQCPLIALLAYVHLPNQVCFCARVHTHIHTMNV